MATPKPISLTSVTAAAYKGAGAPKPYVVVNGATAGSVVTVTKQAAVPDIATADATDLATAITLANATKAKVNALLASLRSAGIIL
jgi:hypothetical protein